MAARKKKAARKKPAQPKGGSRKGKPNKVDKRLVRDALRLACDRLDLADYLQDLSNIHPPSFAGLLRTELTAEIQADQIDEHGGVPLLIYRDYTGAHTQPDEDDA